MNIIHDSPQGWDVVLEDEVLYDPPLFGVDVFEPGVLTIVPPTGGVNEVQTIPDAESDEGSFTITVVGKDGATHVTGAIAFDAEAEDIQTALDLVFPGVVVTGGPISTDDIVLTFSGSQVDGEHFDLVVVTSSLLLAAAPVAAQTVLLTTRGGTITVTFPAAADGGEYPHRWEVQIRQFVEATTTIPTESLVALK